MLVRAAPTTNFSFTHNETIVVASTSMCRPARTQRRFRLARPAGGQGDAGDQRDRPDHRPGAATSTSTVAGQSVTTYTPQASTIVAGQTTYTYNLSLNQQPAGTVYAAIAVPSGIVLSDANDTLPTAVVDGVTYAYVEFTPSDWNTPQAITVSATSSGTPQPEQDIDLKQFVSDVAPGNPAFTATDEAGDVNLTVAATNTPGVLLLQAPGYGAVTPTQTYTYQMVLTSQPTAPVIVTVQSDGQTYATSSDPGFDPTAFDPNGGNPYYVITGVNYDSTTNTTTLNLQAAPGFASTTFTNESDVSVNLAPVSITEDAATNQSLTFGNTGSGSTEAGTITLTNVPSTTTWASLGYTVGNGIYVQGSGLNGNRGGGTFNPTQAGGYYTIASINGNADACSRARR